MALAAYRHLLRSSRIAFQGDAAIFTAARTEIHTRFRNNLSLPASDATKEIAHAEEVAKILLQNIVQGKRQEGEPKEGGDLYKLRIHEHTERGDNDTIKMPNGKTVVVDGKKCSDL